MTKLKLLPHVLTAAMEKPASASGDRVREVVFYAGATITWLDWERFEVIELAFDVAGMDLSRLNSGAPVLDRHQDYSIRDQLGVVQNARIDGKKGKAELRFSKRPDVDPIWADIEDEIIRNVSMGVLWNASSMKDITPSGSKRRKYQVATSVPFEVSLVPSNADPKAQFLSLDAKGRERWAALAMEIEVEDSADAGAQRPAARISLEAVKARLEWIKLLESDRR